MGNYANAISNKINSNLSTMGELSVGTLFKMPTNTANKILDSRWHKFSRSRYVR